MFQESPDNTDRLDVLAEAGNARYQYTDAAYDQLYFNAGFTGFI